MKPRVMALFLSACFSIAAVCAQASGSSTAHSSPIFTDGIGINQNQASILTVVGTMGSDPCTIIKIEPAVGALKILSPDGNRFLANSVDKNHTFQVYVNAPGTNELVCISHDKRMGAPLPDRDKMMPTWHPSGRWIIVAGEKAQHSLQWLPKPIRQGFAECGIWMDMYATTPDGNHWYKLQEMDGYAGPAFTPDGSKAVWAQVVGPVSPKNPFGKWVLKIADFVEQDGLPRLDNVKDITPANTNWVEPGNFHPNGKDLLITADTGMSEAKWQDQFILDINTGHLTNLTNSPKVWDEHGLFSPDGKKIVFMSSYPYRNQPNTWKILGLKTEFMMMNSDGSDLRQLTHFQTPGYTESSAPGTTAACAVFNTDGSELIGTRLLSGKHFPNYDSWKIKFTGRCGNAVEEDSSR